MDPKKQIWLCFRLSTRSCCQLDIKPKPQSTPWFRKNPSAPSEQHLRVNLKSTPFLATGRWPWLTSRGCYGLQLFLLTQGAFNSILHGQVLQLRWMLLRLLFWPQKQTQNMGCFKPKTGVKKETSLSSWNTFWFGNLFKSRISKPTFLLHVERWV